MRDQNAAIWLVHLVAWIFFLALPVVFISTQGSGSTSDLFTGPGTCWLLLLIYIPIFYLHTHFLFTRFFLERKWVTYFISLLVIIILVWYLRPYDQVVNQLPLRGGGPPPVPRPFINDGGPPPPPGGPRSSGPVFDIISLMLLLLVLATSVVVVQEKKRFSALQRAAAAETQRAEAELATLKAQINPHFLFNTLNNIYSLAVMQSERTADAVLRLSNIMRYVTDEVNNDYVPLQHEVDALNDYIALQQLRLGKNIDARFTLSGLPEGKSIAPLLLIPFVENAFKHGISNAAPSPVVISLEVASDHIVFFSSNKIFSQPALVNREGVGVANTRKRLLHLYPGRHELLITTTDNYYSVKLVLYLRKER